MSESVLEKVTMTTKLYGNPVKFASCFCVKRIPALLKDKEKMVLSEKVPTLTIAAKAFGDETVRDLLRTHLFDLAAYYGTTEVETYQIESICEQIMTFYHYLKPTEIILAFSMMKSGQFRQGDSDRAKLYGHFNCETVMDCLYCFRKYRNDILEKEEQRKDQEYLKQRDEKAATQEEKFEIFLGQCLINPQFIETIKTFKWMANEDLKIIQKAVKELEALRLLYKVVEDSLSKIDSGCDYEKSLERVRNGYRYIQKNFYDKQEQN